jgi:opacity protein-like surface antigen
MILINGYTYFQKTDVKFAGQKIGDIGTSAFDVVGKITVPVVDNFGLFAKAGPGYLKSDFHGDDNSATGNTHNFGLVYGFGADYEITPNWVTDISFTRFNGHQKFDNKYQPDADMYAVGVSYKFNV